MAALRQYILSVSAAAILCGLATSLMPKGSLQKILKLICGVFLSLMVLEPITRLDPDAFLSHIFGQVSTEGEAAAVFGEEMARDSMAEYIKQKTEAYILDKAQALGITAVVEVFVGDGDLPVPVSVRIRSNCPSPMQLELEKTILENLGIAKENLQWIGQS